VSTQINVTVGSGGLSDKARQLQTAARQAQLEKERTINLSAEALDKRVAAQAAKGLSPDGLPLYGPGFKQPQIERRPAATRTGDGSYLFYFPTEPEFIFEAEASVRTLSPILKNKKIIPGKQASFRVGGSFLQAVAEASYLPSGGPYQEAAISIKQFLNGALVSGRWSWGSASFFRPDDAVQIFPPIKINYTIEWDIKMIARAAGGSAATAEIAVTLGISNEDGVVVSQALFALNLINRGSTDQVAGNVADIASVSFNGVAKTYLLPIDTLFPTASISIETWQRNAVVVTRTGYSLFINGAEILTDTFPEQSSGNFDRVVVEMRGTITGGQGIKVCAVKFSPKVLYIAPYTPKSLLQ
jgi:hypothetical protein